MGEGGQCSARSELVYFFTLFFNIIIFYHFKFQ